MAQPYQVVQAYDRALIKEIPADDAAALEARLEAAFRLIKVSDGALKPYQRSAILIRAAVLWRLSTTPSRSPTPCPSPSRPASFQPISVRPCGRPSGWMPRRS